MIKPSLLSLSLFATLILSQNLYARPRPNEIHPEPFPVRKVIVAIIDTGADISHPQLKDMIWQNTSELENDLDDDQNGKIDDVHGWNFVEQNSDLEDQHGHGTHIAGIIAQNKNVQLMILKALDVNQTGEAAIEATVNAIYYAIKMKADIINYSGGGTISHPRERMALELAQKKGILVVAAAGNYKANTDQNGFYPASYNLKNIISVAAVDYNGQLLPSSNFGSNSVSVAANGKEVISTLPNKKTGKMTGTSQATAKVTRALASLIYKSKNPFQALILNGKRSSTLTGKLKNPIIIED